jgi:hypothetical protein
MRFLVEVSSPVSPVVRSAVIGSSTSQLYQSRTLQMLR